MEGGCPKCGYGIVSAVAFHLSYTMDYEEAKRIFSTVYDDLKGIAKDGDAEAMRMVGWAIRYGFTDDMEHPYQLWLETARAIKDGKISADDFKFEEIFSSEAENSPNGDENSQQGELDLTSEDSINSFCNSLTDANLWVEPEQTVLDDLECPRDQKFKIGNTEETDYDHKSVEREIREILLKWDNVSRQGR